MYVKDQQEYPSKRTAAWMLFGLYIVLLILLPAGSVLGVNVKIIVFLPLMLFGFQLLAREVTALQQFAFAALVLGVATIWTLRSLIDPFYANPALSQYKDVLTTLIGCLFIRLFTLKPIDRVKFVRLCIYTVGVGSLLKVLVSIYALASGASVSSIVDRISLAFGITLMTIDLDGLGGRLQFPSDNVLPICLFALFALRKKLRMGPWTSLVLVILFVISSLYTFSRFIWGSTAMAAVLGMLVSGKDKMRWVYVGSAAAITIYFLPFIVTLINLRFSSPLASESDTIRVWQIVVLKEFFWAAPLFGNGMGSYPLQLRRSYDVPYAYEVQMLALFGEFGAVGMSLFGLLIVNYYRKGFSFCHGNPVYQFAVLLMFLDFLAGGFFNPYLLVSFSAVSYGLIFVLAGLEPQTTGTSVSQMA